MTGVRLAVGLQKCVGDYWGGDDFSDFNVVVEGTTYRCHRFILAACSGFFQGLFRSNMKECQENSVKIEGIDQETFRVILHSVYRGAGGITLENFLDVWRASEQLQIGFLIDECLLLATNNLSVQNCFKALALANMFVSRDVVSHALKYIAKNFENVNKRVDMEQLSFGDFYNIISSDFLRVSKEDLVLETVVNWCNYDDTAPESLYWNTEFGVVDVKAQDGRMNQSADVKSENDNSNDTKMSFLSTDSFNSQNNNTSFPAELYLDVESENRREGTILGELLSVPTLGFLQDYLVSGAEEKPVAASMKRSHSQTGLDEDSERSDGHKSKVRRSDRSQHLVELVTSCRLCLVSSKYLQQLLETSSTLKSCQETNQMLVRALVYSLDVGQRHDCWPDQAVRRIDGNLSHVMVYWCDTGIEAYNIRTGNRKLVGRLFFNARRCPFVHLAVFDNLLYGVYETGDNNNRKLSAGRFIKGESFTGVIKLSLNLRENARILAHGEYLYFLTRFGNEESMLYNYRVARDTDTVYESCYNIHLEANCLVRFNQYILVFHTTNHVVISECYDTKSARKTDLASTMDGTSAGMTSFIYRGDVFLVQANGSLWKITEAGEDHKIEFELVTRLWDNNITILGLAMFQSKLHLFVNEDSVKNVTFSEDLPTFLPQIVRIPLDITTEMVPMSVPTSWLSEINIL